MRASGELWEFKEVGVESVWLSVIFVKLVIVPTWGTTRAETSDLPKCDFNPRPHVGDDVIIGIITLLKKFQSTSPCGGRRGVVDSYDAGYTFQSTSPHGGRHKDQNERTTPINFNPRPYMRDDSKINILLLML